MKSEQPLRAPAAPAATPALSSVTDLGLDTQLEALVEMIDDIASRADLVDDRAAADKCRLLSRRLRRTALDFNSTLEAIGAEAQAIYGPRVEAYRRAMRAFSTQPATRVLTTEHAYAPNHVIEFPRRTARR